MRDDDPMRRVDLRCTECGRMSHIWRRESIKDAPRIREAWCKRCDDTTAHVEVRGEEKS